METKQASTTSGRGQVQKLALLVAGLIASAPLTWAAGGPDLEQCIRTALGKNPEVQAAAYRVDAARAAIEQAVSAFYPQLTLSSTLTHTDNPPQAFFANLNQRKASLQSDFNQPEDTENLRESISVKYRLWDGGQRSLGQEMASLGAGAQSEARTIIRNELAHQVVRGYYTLLQAREVVKVHEETAQSLEESLRIAGERVKLGSAVKTDVLNLEVKLAQAREDLIRARNGVRLAVAALNTAIGEDLVVESALPEPARETLTPPAKPEMSETGANRAELRAVRLAVELAERNWRKTQADRLPKLSAFGSLDWDSTVNSDTHQSYFGGLVLEWDAFTGFRQRGAVSEARARLNEASAEEQKARNQIRFDLTQAGLQVADAWERLEVARLSVVSAEEALRITRERYEKGATDVTELLTAQVGLTATRTRNVAAYYDFQIAASNLERARGDLGMKYGP